MSQALTEIPILLIIDTQVLHSKGTRMYEEFKKQGYNVLAIDRESTIPLVETVIAKFKPKVAFQTGIMNLRVADCIRRHGIKMIFWYADAYPFSKNTLNPDFLYSLQISDAFITTMRGIVDVMKDTTDKIRWIPSFFADSFYTANKERDLHDLPIDVVFFGQRHNFSPQRTEYLNSLKMEFGDYVKWIGRGGWSKPIFNGQIVANIYNHSKIGLNIISGGVLNGDLQHSVRVFEVMGCGAMLLTEEIPNLSDLFKLNKHCVQFSGVKGLVNKAKYFARNDIEREQIAQEGKKEIFAKHLVSHRIPVFGELIKEVAG